MTSTIGKAAMAKTMDRFRGDKGIHANLAFLVQSDAGSPLVAEGLQLQTQNVPADLAERAGRGRYPAVNIHCLKIVNDLKEKFRQFSGRVWMGVELRHTQDRLDGLEEKLQIYVDSVTRTLDGMRGDWGDGMYYGGGYEVDFGPVKQGGRNVLQCATVKFAIEVGR